VPLIAVLTHLAMLLRVTLLDALRAEQDVCVAWDVVDAVPDFGRCHDW